ncbi:MAG TPA: SRPBCC domain-containing protein [Devosia sp.]|jgi:uncharacterized protein YndB with AHSA1/START domain|nr:SRPBCC domain-containing protein [Devosia sp.]
MTDVDALVFECALDAPPEKVWRALTIPHYRERWLKPAPGTELAVIAADENRSLTYSWREAGAGAVTGVEESVVTFELKPTTDGGTWFRLTHEPVAVPAAANCNGPKMLAA